MILVYGYLGDPPIKSSIEALQDAGASYVLVEMSALDREHLVIEIGPHGVDGCLIAAGQQIPLAAVSSVYARPLGLPSHVQAADSPVRLLHEQLCEWLDVAPGLVVSRPRAMQSNASKPLQTQLIGAVGFRVPATLVTSDEREARAFWRDHGRVVFKSVSGIRSIVQELDERAAQRLGRVAALPTQFQEYVPGHDVRVHVVGTRTFAAAIESPATDYRYAARGGEAATLHAIDLPDEVRRRCVALSQAMDLPFSGIDLRRRPDGEFVCFEVNPMPAYTYYEAHTGLPIGAALATLLMDGNPSLVEDAHGASDRESDGAERQGPGAEAPSPSGGL